MLGILLQVIDRIVQIKKYRSETLHRQFAHIVEPIFLDLEKVHSDYLHMFTDAFLMLQQNPKALTKVIHILAIRRLEFEPVRVKLIATLAELNLELPSFTRPLRLEYEVDRFLREILRYLPVGDIEIGSGTSSSSLLQTLNELNSPAKSPSHDYFKSALRVEAEVERTNVAIQKYVSNEGTQTWVNNPSQCVEFFIELQRDRWKNVCESLAAIKVELMKRC